MRIAGVPLRVSSTTGVLVLVAGWHGYRAVDGYQLFTGPSLGRTSPADPGPVTREEIARSLAELPPDWFYTDPSRFFTTPSLGWVLAAAIGTALVVLGSILLHELGHLAALRRVGVRPTAIHLSGFGGAVTFPDGDRLRAGSLALIAGSGPLVTAALALAAYAALGGTLDGPEPGSPAALVGIELLRVCVVFNAVSLVVNLLPLRALDGGHLLAAARLRLARG